MNRKERQVRQEDPLFREDALAGLDKAADNEKLVAAIGENFERYKNLGVRIEDDVLVTPEGCEVLSSKDLIMTAWPSTLVACNVSNGTADTGNAGILAGWKPALPVPL